MNRPDPDSRPGRMSELWAWLTRTALRLVAGLTTVALLVLCARLQGQTEPASILSITAPGAPGVVSVNDTFSIVVTFSEAVNATALTSFTLNSGGTAILPSAETNVTSLTFSYTVGPADTISGHGPLDVVTADTISVGDVVTVATPGTDEPPTWAWPATTISPAQTILIGPQVQSIVCSSTNPSAVSSGVVQFTVSYSEPMQALAAADFSAVGSLYVTSAVVGTPVMTNSQTAVVPVTITVHPGVTATLALSTVGGQDVAGNILVAGTPAIDQSYSFDTEVPSITALTLASASPTSGFAGHVLAYSVTFSEPVSAPTVANLQMTGVTSPVYTISAGPSSFFTITLDPLPAGNPSSVALTIVPQAGTLLNAVGTPMAASQAAPLFTIDQTQPVITAIVPITPNPTNGLGANAPIFQVTFSKPVSGVAAGDFTLTLGATIQTISPASGPSAIYQLDLSAVPAISGTPAAGTLTVTGLGSPTIVDTLGNTSSGTAPVNGSCSIIQTQPTVTAIVTSAASPTNGQGATPTTFQVTFSEPVTGVTGGLIGSFSAVAGGSLAAATAITVSPSPTTSSSVFSVTVDVPDNGGSGALGLTLSPTGIADAYGNSLAAATPSPDQSYSIIQTNPTLTSLVAINPLTTSGADASALQFLATFSTTVSGVAPGDFTATFGSSTFVAATVSLQGSAVYLVTFPSLAANQGFTGAYTASLSPANAITDNLGNALAASALTAAYTINQTPPLVAAITLLSANPGTAQLQFQVQFSEAVNGVTATDFSAVLGNGLSATASASVASLAPLGVLSSQFTVTLSGLTAIAPSSGTLGVALSSVAGIVDSLGNAAVAATPSPDQSYAIAPPSISSISCIDPNPNPAPGPVDYLVVFSTAVSGIAAANFPFAASPPVIVGIDAPTVSIVSATSCTVQVGGIRLGTGVDNSPLPLLFSGASGSGVRDALGNIAVSTLPSTANAVYIITTEQPVLTLVGQPVTFREGATVTPIHVFDCTGFSDTGNADFVSGTQQGTIDATIFTPVLLEVAPKTVSSDSQDDLTIQPTSGDQFSISNLATSPNGATSATVLLAGSPIGTFTYTTAQRNLHIILTSTTTTGQVQNLINDIVFSNPGDNPSDSNRQVFLSVTDGNGKSSATYTQNVAVSLYNNTTPLVAGVAEINIAPPPRILQPGQSLTAQHILTNDVDSFFVTSLYNASNVLVTPLNETTSLTLPTAKGVVTISLYGDWSYTANPGVSGEDQFVLNVADIGPGKGQYVGGDVLLPPASITQQIFIVPSSFVASSPSITSNPPVEAELGSSLDYLPTMIPGVAQVANQFYDIVDQDDQGFVAGGDFVIDPDTGEVTATSVPTPSAGYIQFAILLEVTDTSGVTRGTYQPVVLKVVSSTAGGG